MEELSKLLKTVRCAEPSNLNKITRTIIKNTCLKQECIRTEDLMQVLQDSVDGISMLQIFNMLSVKNLKTFDENHIYCVLRTANSMFKVCCLQDSLFAKTEEIRIIILNMCINILSLPDEIFPVTSEYESSSPESFHINLKMNAVLSKVALLFYMDIVFSESNNTDWMSSLVENISSSYQRYILKKSLCNFFIMSASRLGKHPWTNIELNKICDNAIKRFCSLTKHMNVKSLFCGLHEDANAMFQQGMITYLFDAFGKLLTKENWKRSATWIHSLIWCVTKVPFPYLGDHVSKVVTMLLLLIDDFSTQNKLLGISSMQYVIQNVNPADLRLYNHANVIHDALFKQLFSNKDNLYEITLPCLLNILCVIEYKSNVVTGITYTLFDKTFEKLLQNIDYTTSFSTRRICLKWLPQYIDKMGGNVIKHADNLLEIIVSCLVYCDGENEILRSRALVVLKHTIYSAWPVVKRYQLAVFKCLLKLLIDLHTPNALCSADVKEKLINQISQILLSLRLCCGDTFDEQIKNVLHFEVEEHFKIIHKILCKVLEDQL